MSDPAPEQNPEQKFRCQHCESLILLVDDQAGTNIPCPKCSRIVEVPFPPLELPREVSEGGSTIYRYEQRKSELELAIGDEENIEAISDHIEKHIGPVKTVFHELVSDIVHIDVHWVEPTAERPWNTWITSGMSDRPMNAPEEYPEYAYSELMICLPQEWPISDEAFEDLNNYWPMYFLKMLARFPHEFDSWLFDCHTIPNGDPPEPFADNTGFSGWILLPPVLVPEEFFELNISPDKKVHFFAIYPLYESEMSFKLEKGADALIDLFEQFEVTEIVDLARPNMC